MFIALATGGAYAANTVFSEDIVDGEVKSRDVPPRSSPRDIRNNSLRAAGHRRRRDRHERDRRAGDAVDTSRGDGVERRPLAGVEPPRSRTRARLETADVCEPRRQRCSPTAAAGRHQLHAGHDVRAYVVIAAGGMDGDRRRPGGGRVPARARRRGGASGGPSLRPVRRATNDRPRRHRRDDPRLRQRRVRDVPTPFACSACNATPTSRIHSVTVARAPASRLGIARG